MENIQSKSTVASEEETVQENHYVPEEEKVEKTLLNVEILDDAPAPVYQIRPHLHEKFKPMSAKEVIHTVLFDQLSEKTYNAQDAIQWTKDIADIIREKIKELNFNRYKYIVNVVLGQQYGAGVKMGTRCIWDAEADTYAYDSFLNVRVIINFLNDCTITIFG
ncbi:tctex1 domain-containing protein 2-like isoform X1 [Apis dorsata]|uniref:tctex1 domain-containing protein 2-like isoform X1 n=1 Tax=Apis dorsata TaxID=7462 RepID=UPI0003DF7C7A|nr:tctex1 domain-containing protein 2-like isoform X1 [Apis dorsata]